MGVHRITEVGTTLPEHGVQPWHPMPHPGPPWTPPGVKPSRFLFGAQDTDGLRDNSPESRTCVDTRKSSPAGLETPG